MIGHCNDGAGELPAIAIRTTAMIVQRIETGDADGDVHQAFPPGTAECVGDDHSPASETRAELAGGGVGITGQNGCEIVARDVRLIDTRMGANETVPRF